MSEDIPLQILIVEDSPTAAELLLIHLESSLSRPFVATQTTTVKESLKELSTLAFDLVLLDLNLPDSQGLDTFAQLHDRFSYLPYVILSGVQEESVAISAVRGGAQDYVVKSALEDGSQIIRSIQFALERYRRVHVESELDAAQHVQQNLYPDEAPELPGFDIYGQALPAERVCGDYYDFIPMKDGEWGVIVGDVSGHGLGPALRMAETRASLQSLSRTWQDLHDLATVHGDLCGILKRTNAVLNEAQTGQFVSLFFAQLKPETRQFTYAAAGHRAHILRADGSKEELHSTGTLLGLLPELEISQSEVVSLEPGDTLCIPTDGIEETMNQDREQFGKGRMLEALRGRSSAREMFDAVCQSARDFAEGFPQKDDMTAILVHCR